MWLGEICVSYNVHSDTVVYSNFDEVGILSLLHKLWNNKCICIYLVETFMFYIKLQKYEINEIELYCFIYLNTSLYITFYKPFMLPQLQLTDDIRPLSKCFAG